MFGQVARHIVPPLQTSLLVPSHLLSTSCITLQAQPFIYIPSVALPSTSTSSSIPDHALDHSVGQIFHVGASRRLLPHPPSCDSSTNLKNRPRRRCPFLTCRTSSLSQLVDQGNIPVSATPQSLGAFDKTAEKSLHVCTEEPTSTSLCNTQN